MNGSTLIYTWFVEARKDLMRRRHLLNIPPHPPSPPSLPCLSCPPIKLRPTNCHNTNESAS